MNTSTIPERIKKYLDGAMSASEEQQFEYDLKKDTALKKAFVAYSIHAHQPPSEKAKQTRDLVEEVYTSLDPVTTPALSWWFRVKMWLRPLPNKLFLAGGLLAMVIAAFWMRQSLPVEQIIADYAERAKCKGVAGEETQSLLIHFVQASDIYCGYETEPATLGKLQQLSAGIDTFCMADYYIAHWYLKNGRYDEAIPAFDACLSPNARKTIEAHPQTAESHNALQLNALLARFGKDKDPASALKALELLAPQVKQGSSLERKINNLNALLSK